MGRWDPLPGGGALGDLSDVDTSSSPPGDGQALVYDSASGLWVPGTISASAPANSHAEVATTESTTSTSFTDLATAGPAVTHTVPASGKVKVTLSAFMRSGSATSAAAQMSFALTGANTVAANSYGNLMVSPYNHANAVDVQVSRVWALTGLTAGATTFTTKYASPTGASCLFGRRLILVEDL